MLTLFIFIVAVSIGSLLFAVYLARFVCRQDCGTREMQEIAGAIREGAEAYLGRQNKTVLALSGLLALLIFLLYGFFRSPSSVDPAAPLELAFWTTLSFAFGATCSVLAGYVGMWVSIRAGCVRRPPPGLASTRAFNLRYAAELFPDFSLLL